MRNWTLERCQSGLMGILYTDVDGSPSRGFESLSLRPETAQRRRLHLRRRHLSTRTAGRYPVLRASLGVDFEARFRAHLE